LFASPAPAGLFSQRKTRREETAEEKKFFSIEKKDRENIILLYIGILYRYSIIIFWYIRRNSRANQKNRLTNAGKSI